MNGKLQFPKCRFFWISSPVAIAMAIMLSLAVLVPFAQAQTYTVIHNFTGGLDGANPYAGLTMDAAGNFYGTTCGSTCTGSGNYPGNVFRLSKKGSEWIVTPLYTFRGGNDGAGPEARVIFGPDGTLYGTTAVGGSFGYGTVFNLRPPATIPPNLFASWTETVLHSFGAVDDGAGPLAEVVFDSAGNMYGTTQSGGYLGEGTVFKLTPAGSGWTESLVYSIEPSDGWFPQDSVTFDNEGNLYGTITLGGNGGCYAGLWCGTIFELMPSASGWTERTIYSFQGGNDGGNPMGGVLFGADGYLYGTTSWGGSGGGGTVFSLNHPGLSPYPLTSNTNYLVGPQANLVMDATGNFYGTTYMDGTHWGTVFRISVSCNGEDCGWNYTLLHLLNGGSDGKFINGSVAIDENGTVYGTALQGGAYGDGVIYAITDIPASRPGTPGKAD
jgi:uncharacterized repeat protein (TIGR03803 family)